MVLSQQRIRTVRHAQAHHSHGAYHHHGNIHIWKDGHNGCANSEAKSAQHVDDSCAQVISVEYPLEHICKTCL